MRCEGLIPEKIVPVWSEFVTDEAGEHVLDVDGRPIKRIVVETIPEHRCEADATQVSRSLKQALCSFNEPHWVKDDPDRAYCETCFKPGTVTDLNNNVSLHPALSIDAYED
jgi:hypothetical protein